jgi:hypothetical protein
VITRIFHEELKRESEFSIEGRLALVSRISKPTIINMSINKKTTIKKRQEERSL